ncbi:MAG: DUF1697 domain-containing protein, partial [Alphaproteobacteria bacterium]
MAADQRRIALLRAVNVGGTGKVAMSDPRAFFSDLGFSGARTVLQTGNVVFDAPPGGDKALENKLEEECAKRFGLRLDFLIRSVADWGGVMARNPFSDFAS